MSSDSSRFRQASPSGLPCASQFEALELPEMACGTRRVRTTTSGANSRSLGNTNRNAKAQKIRMRVVVVVLWRLPKNRWLRSPGVFPQGRSRFPVSRGGTDTSECGSNFAPGLGTRILSWDLFASEVARSTLKWQTSRSAPNWPKPWHDFPNSHKLSRNRQHRPRPPICWISGQN